MLLLLVIYRWRTISHKLSLECQNKFLQKAVGLTQGRSWRKNTENIRDTCSSCICSDLTGSWFPNQQGEMKNKRTCVDRPWSSVSTRSVSFGKFCHKHKGLLDRGTEGNSSATSACPPPINRMSELWVTLSTDSPWLTATNRTGISVAKQCGCYINHYVFGLDFTKVFTAVIKEIMWLTKPACSVWNQLVRSQIPTMWL